MLAECGNADGKLYDMGSLGPTPLERNTLAHMIMHSRVSEKHEGRTGRMLREMLNVH